jgi:hypothetical protein
MTSVHVNTLTIAMLITILFMGAWLSRYYGADNAGSGESNAQQLLYSFSDLAGEYYFGDGCAVNSSLKINPDGTFDRTGAGCEGRGHFEHGSVVLKDHRLELHGAFEYETNAFEPSSRMNFRKTEGTGCDDLLCPVKWGSRLYLVSARMEHAGYAQLMKKAKIDINTAEANPFIGFACDVTSGYEPRQTLHGLHAYIRVGDENKKVAGIPDLPSRYLKYILKQPAKGKIVKVVSRVVMRDVMSPLTSGTEAGACKTTKCETAAPPLLGPTEPSEELTALVNVGRRSGIKPGMHVFVERKTFHDEASVLNVEEDTSLIKFSHQPMDKLDKAPGIGAAVSSAVDWSAPL